MNARRVVLALSVAAVISGGFTFLLSRSFSKSHASANQIRYVSTARQINAGEMLAAADLQTVNWPRTAPLEGAFSKTEDVVGRTVLYPVAKGQPIVDRQLTGVGANAGLSMRVPTGMRALSLKSDQVVGVAGYLLPGTHVDVLVTLHGNTPSDSVTSTVLQDAQILTAGEKMQPDPEGKAAPVNVVTILVTPDQAEKVVLASTQGTLHFVLRNGMDHDVVNDEPARMSELGRLPEAKPAPRQTARVTVLAPAAKGYSVEVLRGEKQSVESFQ